MYYERQSAFRVRTVLNKTTFLDFNLVKVRKILFYVISEQREDTAC